jgi:hypothetical protein
MQMGMTHQVCWFVYEKILNCQSKGTCTAVSEMKDDTIDFKFLTFF